MGTTIAGNPGIYPPPSVMAKLYISKEQPREIMRLMTRDWTNVKSNR